MRIVLAEARAETSLIFIVGAARELTGGVKPLILHAITWGYLGFSKR